MNEKRAKLLRRVAATMHPKAATEYTATREDAPSIRRIVMAVTAINPDGTEVHAPRAVVRSPHSGHATLRVNLDSRRGAYRYMKKHEPAKRGAR